MHGAAHLHHHVVGCIDHIVDRLLADGPEAGRHPLGRGLHLHPANDHAEEPITQFWLVDADGHITMGHIVLASLHLEVERARPGNALQSHAGDPVRSHLPGDPHVREPVSPVRRHLHVHPDIVEAERLDQRLARRDIPGQEHDARLIPAQAELLLRTEHAVGVLPSDLGSLELESPGKCHASCGERVVSSFFNDRGATDDLDHFLSVEDFAQRQTIRIGMTTHRLHLADDHVLESSGHRGDLLDGCP